MEPVVVWLDVIEFAPSNKDESFAGVTAKLEVAVIPFSVPLTVTVVAVATPFGLKRNLIPRVPAGTVTEEGRLPIASFVAIRGTKVAAFIV
jgi:hypothetical protein